MGKKQKKGSKTPLLPVARQAEIEFFCGTQENSRKALAFFEKKAKSVETTILGDQDKWEAFVDTVSDSVYQAYELAVLRLQAAKKLRTLLSYTGRKGRIAEALENQGINLTVAAEKLQQEVDALYKIAGISAGTNLQRFISKQETTKEDMALLSRVLFGMQLALAGVSPMEALRQGETAFQTYSHGVGRGAAEKLQSLEEAIWSPQEAPVDIEKEEGLSA